jgi:hypothetical protein
MAEMVLPLGFEPRMSGFKGQMQLPVPQRESR